MHFGLSEEQQQLEDSLRAFLAERMPIEKVRAFRESGAHQNRELWRALAELGVTGVLIPEEQGGSGLGLLDAALVCQSLGHAVTPSPFLSSSVLAPVALREFPHDAAAARLAGVAKGEAIIGVAVTETFSIREGAGLELRDGRLHGKAMMAQDALEADALLLAAGAQHLALVPMAAPGVSSTPLSTIDATRNTCELVLSGAVPEALLEDAGRVLARMLDAGRIALAADTLGACEAMIEQAVAYAGRRKQFGRVIGSFQAVKHICAEMIAELEPARSLLWYAAHTFDALPEETPLHACQVLAHISEIGREIASLATQVHGGIGWTDEQNLHFWFKRIGAARHLLGGPEYLRGLAAARAGWAPGAAGAS